MSATAISLVETSFSNIEGWQHDDHLAALKAFAALASAGKRVPTTRALGIDGEALAELATKAASLLPATGSIARDFFENHFQPCRFDAPAASGFLTGYFEPVIPASRERTPDFSTPLYRRPDDLIDIDDANRPTGMDPEMRFARLQDGKITPYFDRREINEGALQNLGLEIAWLANKVDCFYVHIQGSGRLEFDDDSHSRVTFSAKAGHPYTSLGKVLCGWLNMPPEEMTAEFLAQWMHDNPERADDLLAENRSYIFFEEIPELDSSLGPIAAAKLPLIGGRSMAVDRLQHTFGTPIWVETVEPLPMETAPMQRLMMAHDTGSVIVGEQRGDYFAGSGQKALDVAGVMRHACSMIVFKPKLDSAGSR